MDKLLIAKETFYAIGLRIIGITITYIFTLYLSRNFSVDFVGAFMLAFTFLQMFTILGKFGLDYSIIRYLAPSINSRNTKEIFIKHITIAIFTSLVAMILMYFFGLITKSLIFKDIKFQNYFTIFSFIVIPLTFLFIIREALRSIGRNKLFIFFQNISIYLITLILIGIISIFTKISESSIIYFFGLSVVLSALLAFKYFFQYIKHNQLKGHIKHLSIIKTSLPLMFANSLLFLMTWSDTLMLGIMMSEKEVGIYTVVNKCAMIILIPMMGIMSLATPKIANLYWQKDEIGMQKLIKFVLKFLVILILPILLLFSFFPKDLLELFGTNYTPYVALLYILLFGQIFVIIGSIFAEFLKISDYNFQYNKIASVYIFLNLSLNFIFIKSFGLYGAAYATATTLALMNMTFVFYAYKKIWKRGSQNEKAWICNSNI